MATQIIDQQLINDFESTYSILNDKISKGFEEFKNYLDSLKDERFEEKPNETEEDAIKRAESIYDRLDEMLKRNETSNKKASETIELLEKMIELFKGIVNNTEDEKEELALRNNEIIDIIIDLEKRKIDKLIDQYPRKKNTLNGTLEDKIEEWNEHRIKTKEMKTKELITNFKGSLDMNEMKQIEEWTGMKIGNIIFDSDVDDWNVNTTEFPEKVKNRSNLIFLIEDEDGNLFGGYVNAIIDKTHDEKTTDEGWIRDSKAFVFSLKSNGRLSGMLKFEIKDTKGYALCVGCKTEPGLFAFGKYYGFLDIQLYKKYMNNQSYCQPSSYNYNEIINAFCGKSNFTPKRVTFIQLV